MSSWPAFLRVLIDAVLVDRGRKVDPIMWDAMKSCTGPVILALLLLVATAGHAQSTPAREVFGQSVEERPLVAYVFGAGPNVTMILGGFHNDEPASVPVVEMLGRYLALHPEEWKGRTVVLVPRVNPDGRRLHSRVNANGVDLNRNFPGTWNMIAAAARYNPGPTAASEPETRAVMQLVEKYAPSKVVSIHQPFHTLNWNGVKGRVIAEEMSLYNGYPMTGDIGYPTPGSFGSYAESKDIGIVTLEMPVADAATCWLQNRDALLAAIRMEVHE